MLQATVQLRLRILSAGIQAVDRMWISDEELSRGTPTSVIILFSVVLMKSGNLRLDQAAREGIRLCRIGYWEKGLPYLRYVSESGVDLDGLVHSYLGFGIASYEKRYKEGLDLCKQAVERHFYQPENCLNLAKTYLLRDRPGHRGLALRTIETGLKVDPAHEKLRALFAKVNKRRPPLLPFLHRDNPANQVLGKLRNSLFG